MQAMAWNWRNQSYRCQGRSSSGQSCEARLPMQGTGADRSVVATKACNGAGAEGSGQLVVHVAPYSYLTPLWIVLMCTSTASALIRLFAPGLLGLVMSLRRQCLK